MAARLPRIGYESDTLPIHHLGRRQRRSKMAAEGVCPFPLPPSQYYKVYTDENVARQIVPDPPPPVDGAYSMFGASFEVLLLFVVLNLRKSAAIMTVIK